jgi:hypothetical protein
MSALKSTEPNPSHQLSWPSAVELTDIKEGFIFFLLTKRKSEFNIGFLHP